MQQKMTLVVALTLVLAGCGSGDISAVEGAQLPGNPSFTIGQALGNRKVCESVAWDEIKDNRDRQVVEYRCHFAGVQQEAAVRLEKSKKSLEDQATAAKKQLSDQIQQLQSDVAKYNGYLTEDPEKQLNDASQGLISMINEHQGRIATASDRLAALQSGDLDKIAAKYKVGDTVFNYIEAYRSSVKNNYTGQNSPDARREQLDAVIRNELATQTNSIALLQREVEGMTAQMKDQLPNRINEWKTVLAQKQSQLDQLTSHQQAASTAVDTALGSQLDSLDKKQLVDAAEVFQWTLDADRKPNLAYAGAELKFKDGTSKNLDYTEAMVEQAIQLAVKNEPMSFAQYSQTLGAAAWNSFIQSGTR